jgi:hypothetical protein
MKRQQQHSLSVNGGHQLVIPIIQNIHLVDHLPDLERLLLTTNVILHWVPRLYDQTTLSFCYTIALIDRVDQ